MHRQRIETFLAHMKTVAPHKFSIHSFVSLIHCKLPEDLINNDNKLTACGAGYMPLVFPLDFEWKYSCPSPYLIDSSSEFCFSDIRRFLEITHKECDFLFSSYTEKQNSEYGTGIEGMIKRLEYVLEGE